MNKSTAIIALLFVLAGFLALFWARGPAPERVLPKGAPQKIPALVSWKQVNRVGHVGHAEPAGNNGAETPHGPALNSEPAERAIAVEAVVTSQGSVVQGAVIGISHIVKSPQTGSIAHSGVFHELTAKAMHGLETTGADGLGDAQCLVASSVDGDDIFEVAAYHPDIGSVALTLKEEQLAGRLELDLASEQSIVGRALDEHGNALVGAVVKAWMQYPGDGVELTGIGNRTGDGGAFVIRGIQYGNTPVLVVGRYGLTEELDGETMTGRQAIRRSMFDRERSTWDVGNLVLRRPAVTGE